VVEPGQGLTDYSVKEYMENIPVVDPSSDAAVDQVINDLSLKQQVAIANMDDFEADVLQAVFEKYIIGKTGSEPERDFVKAVWEKLRKTHKIRSVE